MGRIPQQLFHRPPRFTYRINTTSPLAVFCKNQTTYNDKVLPSASTSPQRSTRTRRSLHLANPLTSRALHPSTYTTSLRPTVVLPPARNMSSDADYASFLDKANQDTGAAQQQSSSKKSFSTKSVDTAVPKALQQVEEYYTSDADEPFEPVSLKFDGSDVSAGRHTTLCTREARL